MRNKNKSYRNLFAWAICLMLAAMPARAAEIVIVNHDGPGEGLNDPGPPNPEMDCPQGMTLGQCRLHAVTAVAERWGSLLESNVQIRVGTEFNPLPCDLFATGGAASIHRDFLGAIHPGTWYPSALADALAGNDHNPNGVDIDAVFNSDLDTGTCSAWWWYGLGGLFPGHLDPTATHFFTVALHQVAHGLGFENYVDETTGQMTGGLPDIFSRFTFDETTGLHWNEMTNAQRIASALNTGQVTLDGPENKIEADRLQTGDAVSVVINDGAAAGTYTGKGGLFGASWAYTDGFSEILEEVNDGTGPSTSDGCEPLVGFTPGRIAFIDRGTCEFGLKAIHAQSAGAYGVVIANNIAGTVAMAPGAVGREVAIPVTLITQIDGNTIRPTLPASASHNVIDVYGMHASGSPLLYAPNPVEEASITHYDPSVGPNALMEPEVLADVGHSPDMTLGLLRDLGWQTAAQAAGDPAVTGFDGGAQYSLYYGGSTGDVVGYRFTVNSLVEVVALGVWNADAFVGGEGLSAPHRIGIWDASMHLLTSNTVYPTTGEAVNEWTYARTSPVVLHPGRVYTAGALYTGFDRDSYISSAANVFFHPTVTWVESTYPAAGSLGFVFPELGSASFGRLGPNFLFLDPIPIFLDGFESGNTSAWN